MSYRMLEELQSRKKEKVAMFLTFENIIGLILLGFPIFVGSAALPLLLRVPVVAGAALLGVLLTLDSQGLPVYGYAARLRHHLTTRVSRWLYVGLLHADTQGIEEPPGE
jgi:hypothetical protein